MHNFLDPEVTAFLEALHHPLMAEISALRSIVLETPVPLAESIKWNGPNYTHHAEDRVTMRIQPPKQVQLIFHRGAKVKAQPATRLLQDDTGLLAWKANDRAVMSFKSLEDITSNAENIQRIILQWVEAA